MLLFSTLADLPVSNITIKHKLHAATIFDQQLLILEIPYFILLLTNIYLQ